MTGLTWSERMSQSKGGRALNERLQRLQAQRDHHRDGSPSKRRSNLSVSFAENPRRYLDELDMLEEQEETVQKRKYLPSSPDKSRRIHEPGGFTWLDKTFRTIEYNQAAARGEEMGSVDDTAVVNLQEFANPAFDNVPVHLTSFNKKASAWETPRGERSQRPSVETERRAELLRRVDKEIAQVKPAPGKAQHESHREEDGRLSQGPEGASRKQRVSSHSPALATEYISDFERKCIVEWVQKNHLNKFGQQDCVRATRGPITTNDIHFQYIVETRSDKPWLKYISEEARQMKNEMKALSGRRSNSPGASNSAGPPVPGRDRLPGEYPPGIGSVDVKAINDSVDSVQEKQYGGLGARAGGDQIGKDVRVPVKKTVPSKESVRKEGSGKQSLAESIKKLKIEMLDEIHTHPEISDDEKFLIKEWLRRNKLDHYGRAFYGACPPPFSYHGEPVQYRFIIESRPDKPWSKLNVEALQALNPESEEAGLSGKAKREMILMKKTRKALNDEKKRLYQKYSGKDWGFVKVLVDQHEKHVITRPPPLTAGEKFACDEWLLEREQVVRYSRSFDKAPPYELIVRENPDRPWKKYLKKGWAKARSNMLNDSNLWAQPAQGNGEPASPGLRDHSPPPGMPADALVANRDSVELGSTWEPTRTR